MKVLSVGLLLVCWSTAMYAEHAGRGLMRHSRPGIVDTCAGETVDLSTHRAAPVVARQSVCQGAPDIHAATWREPIFSAVCEPDQLPVAQFRPVSSVQIPDAFEPPASAVSNVRPAVAQPPTPESVAPMREPVAVREKSMQSAPTPTPEQLALMREHGLSVPPTIYDAAGKVRAAGQSVSGQTVSPMSPMQASPCIRCLGG